MHPGSLEGTASTDFDTATDDEALFQAEVAWRRGGTRTQGFELWQRNRLVYRQRSALEDRPPPPAGRSQVPTQDRAG